MKNFRFGIMGAAKIAEKFCDAVTHIPNCEVAAIASRDLERAKAFANKNEIANAYDNYAAMLAQEELDCVYIAVVTSAHYELTMLCLNHKVPVLCEKAMFVNSREAEEVFTRAAKEQVFVMEATWSRFLPALQKAKSWLDEERIGVPKILDFAIGFAAPEDPKNRYYNAALGGGAARDITIYAYEITDFMLEQEEKQSLVQVEWSQTGIDLTNHVTIQFEQTMATLTTSFAVALEERMIIYGKKGKIIVPTPHFASECLLYNEENQCVEHFKDEITPNGFLYEIQEAMQCITEGKLQSSVVPHELTLRCAKLFDQIDLTKN